MSLLAQIVPSVCFFISAIFWFLSAIATIPEMNESYPAMTHDEQQIYTYQNYGCQYIGNVSIPGLPKIIGCLRKQAQLNKGGAIFMVIALIIQTFLPLFNNY
ncbi:MAG: hypothetical protein M3R00_04820 [Pseudomonadota bacterium]|nr:hypothetical protein [Pseudomonadota bacterium]